MNPVKVIICSDSVVLYQGLAHFIEKISNDAAILFIAGIEDLLSHQPDSEELIILDCSLIDKLPRYTLEKLTDTLKDVFCIAFVRNELPENINIRFTNVLYHSDTEDILIEKLQENPAFINGYVKEKNGNQVISDREMDVLKLVAMGYTNKEISEKLFISSHTVITHRKNITSKLGIKTIAGLAVYAVLHGIIVPEEMP